MPRPTLSDVVAWHQAGKNAPNARSYQLTQVLIDELLLARELTVAVEDARAEAFLNRTDPLEAFRG